MSTFARAECIVNEPFGAGDCSGETLIRVLENAFRVPLTPLVLTLLFIAGCDRPAYVLRDWELVLTDTQHVFLVQLPEHLNGRVPDRDLTFELRTTYLLPRALRGGDLDFVLPHFWGATELWVDGVRAVSTRAVPAPGHRPTLPHVYRIPAQAGVDGQLSLRLRVKHRWTQSAWFDVVPRLVRADESDPMARRAQLFNGTASIVAGALLVQIGIAALAIYFIGGRRREYWWLGIQALLAASYPFFIHGSTQRLFGRYEVSFLAASLISATWASLRFAHVFFERERWSRWWDVLGAGCILTCLLGVDPYWSTAVAARATVVMVGTGVVSQVALGARLLFDPRTRHDARWFIGCWVALALTTWSDMGAWYGLGEVFGGAHVACVGLAAFSFFLSLMLSQRHLSSLSRSDRLAVELERRVRELEHDRREIAKLNVELRRQIAERSEQIYAALALRDRATHPATALNPGDLVQGRYRVVSLRGAGGMGAVYEVERLQDGRRLALKLARESHGQALALLAREAQIAAQISHPNIVKIVDVDVASSGFLFLVMELVEGRPLHHLSERYGDPLWALTVLRQVAGALATLHEAGIVHRDVKPPNILVVEAQSSEEMTVKVTDFGIARFSPTERVAPVEAQDSGPGGPPTSELDTVAQSQRATTSRAPRAQTSTGDTGLFTRSGKVAGTPLYMAPELAVRGTKASSKADVYSLGVLAWELLAKRRPSLRPAAAAVLAGEVPEPLPSLRPVAAHTPAEVSHAIDACLQFDPELRPSCSELEGIFEQGLARMRKDLQDT